MIHTDTARTQKAKGVIALGRGGGIWLIDVRMDDLTIEEKVNSYFSYRFGSLAFARPCPMRPRHGFVDSRIVESPAELMQVVRETRAEDPDGEVIVAIPIGGARGSAIWTPGRLTIGNGNDGATCGVDTVTIPLSGGEFYQKSFLVSCGVVHDQWPYVEMVRGAGDGGTHPYLVQLRAGPKVDQGGIDFVPREVEVKDVLRVDHAMSLLDWERLIASRKDETGLVIHHPAGSLVDHFAVHAISYGIPVVVSEEPVAGTVIAPRPIEPPDPTAVARGVIVGGAVAMDAETLDTWAALMLLGFHNSTYMGGQDGEWIGVAASILMRLGSIALRGEARHEVSWKKHKSNRAKVYEAAVNRSLTWHQASMPKMMTVFRYGHFSGGGMPWSTGSMGGLRWDRCAAALAPVFNAAQDVVRAPSADTVSALLRVMNVAVNQAHNGGWWFNKFIGQKAFVEIPNNNPTWVGLAIPAALAIRDIRRSMPADRFERLANRVMEWRSLAPRSARIRSVDIVPTGWTTQIVLRTAHSRRPIAIDIPGDIPPTTVYVRSENGLMSLWARNPTLKRVWREPELIEKVNLKLS